MSDEHRWHEQLVDLVRRAAVLLPEDVRGALGRARQREADGCPAAWALETMLDNARLAQENQAPICQDTGTLILRVEAPPGTPRTPFENAAKSAVREAVETGFLRRNCVQTETGKNTGDGVGRGNPVFHWVENDDIADIRVALALKGGGCENVGRQYALPNHELGAERSLDGVRRCALDAVYQAQGLGCAPGVLAVVVGGDRATGYTASKELFFRQIGQRNTNRELATLETTILEQANGLGIGPMGFGGETTLLDVFVDVLDRLPASYFVTVSYMCWAFRRAETILSPL